MRRLKGGKSWSAMWSRTGARKPKLCWPDLEALPVREYEYRGVTLREFDVDAALARHPELLLVDELAHTNAAGCRHEKRWQDVEELLDAGINVWTTLNVQHIESLNDVIGQITGVVVRETVPDRVFDLADDLELVDITPEELLVRLKAGKVYVPEQAQRAIQSFFQKANLTALRELSLRQAARRVHTDVEIGSAGEGGDSTLGDGGATAGLRGAKPHDCSRNPHGEADGGGTGCPLAGGFSRSHWRTVQQPAQATNRSALSTRRTTRGRNGHLGRGKNVPARFSTMPALATSPKF